MSGKLPRASAISREWPNHRYATLDGNIYVPILHLAVTYALAR